LRLPFFQLDYIFLRSRPKGKKLLNPKSLSPSPSSSLTNIYSFHGSSSGFYVCQLSSRYRQGVCKCLSFSYPLLALKRCSCTQHEYAPHLTSKISFVNRSLANGAPQRQ
jgi:hypothetical protein